MGLRFIYGRAGTGKTTYCFNEIKEKINKNNKIYIITPEQFSYSAERRLLEVLGTDASINAEVISFNRLANRIFTEVGGANEILISKSAKAMLIFSALEKEKKNLHFLGNSKENIEVVLKEITELKKNNISTEKIEKEINNILDIELKEKLKEINIVYKQYENYIKNKYIDEEDILTKLYEKIPKSKMFENSIVYIDEFSGFTKQEYNIFQEILKKAKQVNITVCTDKLEENSTKESDLFYFNKQFIKLLTKCGQNVNKKIEEHIFLENKNRFKNLELKHLEENIYKNKIKEYNSENKNIKLFLAKTPYTEIEYIAENIIKLVRDKNFKYNEIAIITKNIENINNIAKAIFSKYDIPIFIDEKIEITENIVIKYILSILEIYSSNWNTEAVLNYIKSGFLDIEENDIYKIEKYIKKCGINRNKWYKNTWRENEEIRKKIVNPLLKLKKELDEEKNAKKISEKIYNYLLEINIKEKVNKKIEKLNKEKENKIAEEYIASLNILIDVLDEIVAFFKEEKMNIEEFKELLKIGLKNKEIGKIPQYLDQVMLGDVDRTRTHKIKAIFILGINDGIFPGINKNEGFLNDKDRELLKNNNLEIAKGTLDNLYEDQFNIYKALTTAEEKVYLSYTSSNKEGVALRPSVIILKIKKIFPRIKEESDIINKKTEITNQKVTYEELLKNIRKNKNGELIEDIWIDVYNWYNKNDFWKNKLNNNLKALEYSNKADKINEQNIKKLYGETLRTSVSKLEQYRKCPFSFHLKYGLKIKEQEEYNLRPIDTGTFMHEVLDEFFEKIEKINLIENDEIETIVEDIINEKLKIEKNYIFVSSPKFIVLTNRLKKTIKEAIKYIIYQMKISDFKLSGHEVEFSKKIENVEIIGKIDRLDTCKNEEGQYIRIIDYKSSNKNIDLNQMIAGTQIQLLTYIDVISQKENKEPAGVFYYNLIEPIIQSSKNLSNEEIEEKIRKSFKMKGLILADLNVIKMMDKTLDKGFSNSVPVYIDKEGNISKNKSSTITKEDFNNLQKTIRKIIKEISKEILSGKIDIEPAYDNFTKSANCIYCEYKTVCAFNTTENKYNYIKNYPKDKILEEIKENNY